MIQTASETSEKMQNGIITNGTHQNGVSASLKNEENTQLVNGTTSNGLSNDVENIKNTATTEQSESINDKEVFKIYIFMCIYIFKLTQAS